MTYLGGNPAGSFQINLDWKDDENDEIRYNLYCDSVPGFTADETNRIATNLRNSQHVDYLDQQTPQLPSYFQKLWTAATGLSGDSFTVDEHDAVDQVLQLLAAVQFSPA